jgi:hypothetical protein
MTTASTRPTKAVHAVTRTRLTMARGRAASARGRRAYGGAEHEADGGDPRSKKRHGAGAGSCSGSAASKYASQLASSQRMVRPRGRLARPVRSSALAGSSPWVDGRRSAASWPCAPLAPWVTEFFFLDVT